jgi:hypothetical protein
VQPTKSGNSGSKDTAMSLLVSGGGANSVFDAPGVTRIADNFPGLWVCVGFLIRGEVLR